MGEHSSCVDEWATHDWEADVASRLANGVAFWIWYLPAEMIRQRRRAGVTEAGAAIASGAGAGPD